MTEIVGVIDFEHPLPLEMQSIDNSIGFCLSGRSDSQIELYSQEDLSSLGLSIYTTFDTQVQDAAETALVNGLERLERNNPALQRSDPLKKLQGAIIVIQPKTGYILAMVGGRDYGKSQFNRITQARRQTGSAFKPFVYLTALDTFTPSSLFSSVE